MRFLLTIIMLCGFTAGGLAEERIDPISSPLGYEVTDEELIEAFATSASYLFGDERIYAERAHRALVCTHSFFVYQQIAAFHLKEVEAGKIPGADVEAARDLMKMAVTGTERWGNWAIAFSQSFASQFPQLANEALRAGEYNANGVALLKLYDERGGAQWVAFTKSACPAEERNVPPSVSEWIEQRDQ